ncbi:MAG: TonB-dependent receptor [Gammaproteobacteria bacterium]|nr:TonB-dependent receptor [Gammaproteobacteria bacterium]
MQRDRQRSKITRRGWRALLIAGSLVPWTARAADSRERPADAAADDHRPLREIVVTATRRAEPAQNVGIALTAVSGRLTHSLRVEQPLDLSLVDPSLSTMNAQTDGTPLFLLRGIGLDDFNNNNSSGVGIYQDGVFASFPGFLTDTLYDVGRVEILKGPQGTLYGKNTDGGAINIISAQPTDHFGGYVELGYSRWNTVDLTGAVSGPLNDRVKARLAGTMTTQGEGYQTDLGTGQRYGKLHRGGARALFDIRLSDAANLDLNLHWVYDRSVPSSPSTPNVEALIPPEPFPTAGLMDSPPGGTRVRVGGLPLYKHEVGGGASAKLKVAFAAFTLTSISAYDYFTDHSLDNYDGYPAADNNWTKNFQQWQLSQEVRLTSKSGGPVDWIIGAIYSQNWYRNRDALDWTFVYGLATDMTQQGLAITAENFVQRQRSSGVYANVDTHLSSRLTLVTGLRYSHDRTSFDGVTIDPTGLLTYAANNFSGPIVPNTVLAALDDSRSNQNVSYRVGLDYHLRPEVLLYGSVASGYKAGIYYGQPAQVQVDWGYVQPETNLTSELGIKSRFLDDSVQLDMDVFDSVIRNRQSSLSLWAGPVGTQPLIAGLGNVPRSRIDGIEVETDWRPVRGLEIHLAATRLDARVTQTLTSDNGLALFTPVQVGQMLPDAPNFTWSYIVHYEHPLSANFIGFVQANDRFVGAIHPYLGDPTTFGRGHDMGVRVGIRSRQAHWNASLWSTNVTDARPLTYAFAGSEGQRVSFYQRPRSVGIDFTYEF